jgi:thiol:disulfide interchange protein
MRGTLALLVLTSLVATLFAGCGEELGDPQPLAWTEVNTPAELKAAVAAAGGRPVVVDFSAEWCHYCKLYEKLADTDPALNRALRDVVRLRVDLTSDPKRFDMRTAVGLKIASQPYFAFFSPSGALQLDLALAQWYEDGPTSAKRFLDSLGTVHTR